MFGGYYNSERFRYIHDEINNLSFVRKEGNERIKKTGCFYGEKFNFYIDTSDGVNEDLNIQEYCGRILTIIEQCDGKPFLFFKAAYSPSWSQNIMKLAEQNNGKVIPFFKWSFNNGFYRNVFGKRDQLADKRCGIEKEYDIGYFCGLRPYDYPRPSKVEPLISWSDHAKFNIPGNSLDTGNYVNNSRKLLYNKIIDSPFKVLHREKLNYYDYIIESYKCKVILNPPGVGEYTSRMFEQSYLGNCVALRKNSYDNGISWKNHIPEVDFDSNNWEDEMASIISNYEEHGRSCREYFDSSWTSEAVVNFLINKIEGEVKL